MWRDGIHFRLVHSFFLGLSFWIAYLEPYLKDAIWIVSYNSYALNAFGEIQAFIELDSMPDALNALQALDKNFLLHYASSGRIELPETAGFLGFV